MSQANVYTSASSLVWYTDKCAISTGDTSVTYQVYVTALGTQPAVGNIYSEPSAVDPYSLKEIYVGVGNYLTIVGTNFTVQELGTATSAQSSVFVPGEPVVTLGDYLVTQDDYQLITQDDNFIIT